MLLLLSASDGLRSARPRRERSELAPRVDPVLHITVEDSIVEGLHELVTPAFRRSDLGFPCRLLFCGGD
jgi:hypothetical protein